MPWPFVRGQAYNRRQHIHAPFGGQQQGGIITPAQRPLVICITGKSGEQHGYADGWTANGAFAYFGEGQVGDMELKSGNSAILEHSETGEDLLLFEKQADGALRYEAEFICAGYRTTGAPDRNGDTRKAIVFDLVPIDTAVGLGNMIDETPALDQSLDDLRDAALAAVKPSNMAGRTTARTVHQRSSVIRRYVFTRANGECELCKADAPFLTAKVSRIGNRTTFAD